MMGKAGESLRCLVRRARAARQSLSDGKAVAARVCASRSDAGRGGEGETATATEDDVRGVEETASETRRGGRFLGVVKASARTDGELGEAGRGRVKKDDVREEAVKASARQVVGDGRRSLYHAW